MNVGKEKMLPINQTNVVQPTRNVFMPNSNVDNYQTHRNFFRQKQNFEENVPVTFGDPWLDRINSVETPKTVGQSFEQNVLNLEQNIFGQRRKRRMRQQRRNNNLKRRQGDAAFRTDRKKLTESYLVDNDYDSNEIMSKIVNRDAIVDERQTEFYGSSPGMIFFKLD